MTSTEVAHAARLTARTARRDYFAVYPPAVLLLTTLPRMILQALFFAYIGDYAAGARGREFAYIGACTQIVVLATVVRAADSLLDERVMGTLHRVRLGVLPLPLVVVTRWWIYALEGLVCSVISFAIVGALVNEGHELPRILAASPLIALLAITTSGLGVVAAAIAFTQRADVLVTNLVSYLTIVVCGVVAPIDTLGHPGETLARCLPLTNGLLAIRDVVAGRRWIEAAALEALVGTCWLAIGIVALLLQERRGRARGTDEQF